MNYRRTIAIAAATLVVGLAVGNLASAGAATRSAATSSGAVAGSSASCGLGLGASIRDAGGRLIDIVASLTGLSADKVQEARNAGKTFSQIAEENGVDSGKVVDGALATREQVLDARVAAGELTQEEADAALAQMGTRLQQRIDSTGGCGGGGRGGGQGGGRMGGSGGCGGGGCGQLPANQ